MADLGLWTGLNQGVQNTIATGMNLMQLQSQREHQRALEMQSAERLKLAQEQATREQTIFQHAEKKRVEQEQIDNAIVPASLIAPQIHGSPKFRALAIETARKAGFKVDELPDGEIYTTNKAYSYIGNLMKTSTDFQKISTDSIIEDLIGKSTALGAKITEIQQSGKEDKTLPALQQQQIAVKKQIGEMLGASRSVMEKILVEQSKLKQADTTPYMTQDGKTVLINERDPKSQMIISQQGLVPASTYNAGLPGKVPTAPVELVSADGKTAQKMRYNPVTDKHDIPVGEPYPVKSQVININAPPERNQQTQFIDDSDGTPLIFSPRDGEYKRPDGKPIGSAVRRQPADMVVAGATFETLKDTAKSILEDPKRHNYVGPYDSIVKKFKAAIIGDADFSAFRTKIEQMIETSYALSGKQISAKEIEMLKKLRGSLDQPDETFDAAMKEYLSWLENKTKTRKAAFGSQGYSTGGGSTLPQGYKKGWD